MFAAIALGGFRYEISSFFRALGRRLKLPTSYPESDILPTTDANLAVSVALVGVVVVSFDRGRTQTHYPIDEAELIKWRARIGKEIPGLGEIKRVCRKQLWRATLIDLDTGEPIGAPPRYSEDRVNAIRQVTFPQGLNAQKLALK
jgi:hypothetical protein